MIVNLLSRPTDDEWRWIDGRSWRRGDFPLFVAPTLTKVIPVLPRSPSDSFG